MQTLIEGLDRMIEIGLPYLHLNRETPSLSGGEAQRLKLVRYMGSSLTGMTYIFDEPSAGMHPRDVYRMNNLLKQLRDKGNTVLVVEHDKDVISIADYVIDVGPQAGQHGGEIVFAGSYPDLLKSDTLTGNAMLAVPPRETGTAPAVGQPAGPGGLSAQPEVCGRGHTAGYYDRCDRRGRFGQEHPDFPGICEAV